MCTAGADRWTCPTCGVTTSPTVPVDEVHDAIVEAQLEHAAEHTGRRHAPEVRICRAPRPNAPAAAPPLPTPPAAARTPLTPLHRAG